MHDSFLSDISVNSQLSITSLPTSLFNNGARSVVEGSVIWLFCEVNSTANSLSATWSKDGAILEQDIPRIRLRTSNTSSSTTLLLVIDYVELSDAGFYQCNAMDGQEFSVTGMVFNMTGTLFEYSLIHHKVLLPLY